jgi:hypothetical protein
MPWDLALLSNILLAPSMWLRLGVGRIRTCGPSWRSKKEELWACERCALCASLHSYRSRFYCALTCDLSVVKKLEADPTMREDLEGFPAQLMRLFLENDSPSYDVVKTLSTTYLCLEKGLLLLLPMVL